MWRTACSLRWLPWHLLLVLALTVCGLFFYWQLDRALSPGGDAQNAAYAVQWPIFAGFFVVVWWKQLREDAKPPQDRAPRQEPFPLVPPPHATRTADVDDSDDPELAAYNRMLADLNSGEARR